MARDNRLDSSLQHIFATQGQKFQPYERDGNSITSMSWFPLSTDANLGRGGALSSKAGSRRHGSASPARWI